MTVKEVAAFLDVQEVRVERLKRESLLIAKDKDVDGAPLFAREDVSAGKSSRSFYCCCACTSVNFARMPVFSAEGSTSPRDRGLRADVYSVAEK